LYAEFTCTGAAYVPYPDPRSHRIRLADLRDDAVRARLRSVWLDPLSLDPTRQSARVTREIAAHLAEIAKSLEAAGHAPETVAGFLTRCLFSMFAEDVALIPKGSFTELLNSLADDPAQFVPLVGLQPSPTRWPRPVAGRRPLDGVRYAARMKRRTR
jgi:hypothetical protein